MSGVTGFSLHELRIQDYLAPEGLSVGDLYVQAPLVVVLWALAKVLIRLHFPARKPDPDSPETGLDCWKRENVTWFLLLLFLSVITLAGRLFDYPVGYIRVAWVLLGIWLLVSLLVSYSRERVAVRLIAITGYVIIALYLLGGLERTVTVLDNLRLQLGSMTISAYGVISGAVMLVVMLWLAQFSSRLIESRIIRIRGLSASVKVLVGKAVKITFISVALVIAVDSMGLDLTVLTVLGGGLGLGLGFGLQAVVSNLLSGFILLTDKSIKPGDVIEVGDTYGWINTLSARYVSIITRDGTEHLIPNETLITQPVINWSFTHNLVRLKIPVGVSYKSDVLLARELIIDACKKTPRVLADPDPECHILGFGDSSVDLEARIWISDPSNGIVNVKSEILIKIWNIFQKNGIEIPFPQRDVHIKEVPDSRRMDACGVSVQTEPTKGARKADESE